MSKRKNEELLLSSFALALPAAVFINLLIGRPIPIDIFIMLYVAAFIACVIGIILSFNSGRKGLGLIFSAAVAALVVLFFIPIPEKTTTTARVITDPFSGQQIVISDTDDLAQALQDMQRRQSEEYMQGILKENKNAVRTASGLVYEIIEPGESPGKIKDTETVIMDWEVSSRGGGGMVTLDGESLPKLRREFTLEEMMPGMAEGIQLIGKGGRIKLYIPAHLIYKETETDYPQLNSEFIVIVDLIGFE